MAQRFNSSITDATLVAQLNNIHKAIVTSPSIHADGPEYDQTTLAELQITNWPASGSAPSTPSQAQDFLANAKTYLNLHLGRSDADGPYGTGIFAHKVADVAHLISSTPASWAAAETALSEATRVMVNEMSTDYEGHRSAAATTIHHIVDTDHYIGQSPLTFTGGEWNMQKGVERINLLKQLWNDHVTTYAVNGVHSATDAASVVAAANCTYDSVAGTDWYKVIALLTEMYPKMNNHFANGTIHDHADTRTITSPLPAEPGDTYTLVNEMITDYAAHIASTTYHYGADSTNTVATAGPVSDLATLVTAAQQFFVAIYGHARTAPTSKAARLYP
jgi:hypothetical protein